MSLGEASQLELELSFKSKMDTHEISLILDDLSMCCIDADESATQENGFLLYCYGYLLIVITTQNH